MKSNRKHAAVKLTASKIDTPDSRIECVHCHGIKNKIKNHAVDKVKKL